MISEDSSWPCSSSGFHWPSFTGGIINDRTIRYRVSGLHILAVEMVRVEAMTESERILHIIGKDCMQKLVDEYGGTNIYIPKMVPIPDRDSMIKSSFEESLKAGCTCMNSYEQLAEDTGLSLRRVREIVNA